MTDRALTRTEAGRSQGHRRAGASSSAARPAPCWGRSAGPGPPAACPAARGPRRRRTPSLHQQFTCHVIGCRHTQRERESARAGKATTRNKNKRAARAQGKFRPRARATRRDAEPAGSKRNRQHCCSHLRAGRGHVLPRHAYTPAPPRFDWGASGSLAASPAAQLGRLLLSRSLLFSFHEPAGTGSEPAYGESPLSNGTLKGSRSENQATHGDREPPRFRACRVRVFASGSALCCCCCRRTVW